MLIAGTLRQGKAVKDSAGYDSKLNKVVALNSDNRVLFRLTPVINEETGNVDFMDLIAASIPGRSCNFDVCGTAFIKLNKEQIEYDENTKKLKDNSGLDAWAKIAKVLHAAECAQKKKLKELEAKAIATGTNTQLDTTKLNMEFEKLDIMYFGGKDSLGKRVMPDVQPIISSLQYKMTTQVLVIPMVNDKPDYEKAKTAYLELSNDRIAELINIIEDAKYCSIGDKFLEVGYKFYGKDTKEAGRRAKLEGITKEYRLSTVDPEGWATGGKRAIDRMVEGPTVVDTAELMAGRNINVSSKKSVSDIETAIRKYCATNPGVIANINVESDEVKYAAKALVEKGLVDSMPNIKTSLEELLRTESTEETEAVAGQESTKAVEQLVMEAVQNKEEGGTLTELTKGIDNVDALAGDEFEGEM